MDDPWHWTVDDVVNNLCYKDALWADRSSATRPNASFLETTLRQQDIDGPSLLLDIDDHALRHDIGLNSLGQRSSTKWVIQKLRDASAHYQSNYYTFRRIPSNSPFPQHSVDSDTKPVETPLNSTNRNGANETSQYLSTLITRTAPGALFGVYETSPITPSRATSPPSRTCEPNVRPNEQMILHRGNLTRRLELTAENKSTKAASPESEDPASAVFHIDTTTSHPSSSIETHILTPNNPSLVTNETNVTYLPTKKIVIDEIFYGSLNNGDIIPDDPDDIDNFEFRRDTKTAPPLGFVNFVNARMKHHLHHPGLATTSSSAIVHPYPERLVIEKNQKSITLFKPIDGAIAAIKTSEFHKHNLSNETEDQDGSYDYLLSKYPPSDKEPPLPIYNESGSENDFDEELLAEIQNEANIEEANKSKGKSLSFDEIHSIIAQQIENFRNSWQVKKAPWRRRQALSVWRKFRGRNARQAKLDTHNELNLLNRRLEKLMKEIGEHRWPNVKQLQDQCRSLETTVHAQEEIKWSLELCKQSDAPPRILEPLVRAPIQKTGYSSEDDGESIDSESHDLDDFMDIDEATSVSPGPDNREILASSTHSRIVSPSLHDRSPLADAQSAEEEVDMISDSEPENKHESLHEPTESFDWHTLESQMDKLSIILKLLSTMSPELRDKLDHQIMNNSFNRLKEDIQKALASIKNDRANISGVKDENAEVLFKLARLWVCWNSCKHQFYTDPISPKDMAIALKMIDLRSFYEFLMSKVQVANPSDDETSPRSKRKNKVIRSRQAQNIRSNAQKNRAEGEERARKLELDLNSNKILGQNDKIIVNNMKHEDESLIYLNDHIANKIKSHQIAGLRFLWREIVHIHSSKTIKHGKHSDNDSAGCLLAHTMGLGKTMQAISLLVTIAEASAASDTTKQIPPHLQSTQVLILCPAGLIENWKDEFHLWTPPNCDKLGEVYHISATDSQGRRFQTVKQWDGNGGILILGYDMFRILEGASRRIDGTNDDESAQISRCLTQRPTIVIADEAHRLKSRFSLVGKATARFRTKTRIALTGSPLANNLGDYFAMIDWVSPGFLGSVSEFKAFYQEPIETGFSESALNSEYRMALKKLRALKQDIDPRVQRADISVISHEIPAKTEFVIILPLSDWQHSAYSAFIESISNGMISHNIVGTKLFNYIHLLALLCFHPHVFLKALSDRVNSKAIDHRATSEKTDENSISGDITTEVESLEVSNSMLELQHRIAPKDYDTTCISFSYKMMIIRKILIASKQLGDRVLIFAQHISTIDFIEKLVLNMEGFSYCRLDGSTKMNERIKTVKDFNLNNTDVFLISTRAGSLGLNISIANRVILVDFSFNPMHEEQAVGRAYRIGQKKSVFVYHLVTGGTYEKDLHNAVVFKKLLAARVVDQKNLKRAASKEAQYLFPPRHVVQEDLTPFANKDIVMDALLQDLQIGSIIKSLKTVESMHIESNDQLTADEEKEAQQFRLENRYR